jgi:hypothetical protein
MVNKKANQHKGQRREVSTVWQTPVKHLVTSGWPKIKNNFPSQWWQVEVDFPSGSQASKIHHEVSSWYRVVGRSPTHDPTTGLKRKPAVHVTCNHMFYMCCNCGVASVWQAPCKHLFTSGWSNVSAPPRAACWPPSPRLSAERQGPPAPPVA